MTTKEFLQRESALALRFGIRKTDAYYQLVRCTACGNEALLRNRYSGRAFSSVDEVEEEMLAQIQREIRAACVSCGARPLRETAHGTCSCSTASVGPRMRRSR